MFIDRVLDQLQREKIPQQIKNSNKHILNINENIYINNAGNIFLFDVDGTLTPARQPMNKDFHSFFLEWMQDKKVYFVF